MKKAWKRVLQLDFAKKLRQRSKNDGRLMKKCTSFLQKRGRKIVAFYSNPNILAQTRHETRLPYLNAIDLDMRYILQTYSPFDVYLQPALMKGDIARVLELYTPEVVIWSGHTLGGALVMTTSENRAEMYPTEELVKLFGGLKNAGLKLVCIMACNSGPLCERIHEETGIDAIGWETVVEDHAAWIFSIKVFEYLLSHEGVDAHQVFEHAKQAVEECHTVGSTERCYTMGDPKTHTPQPGDDRWVAGIPRLYSSHDSLGF